MVVLFQNVEHCLGSGLPLAQQTEPFSLTSQGDPERSQGVTNLAILKHPEAPPPSLPQWFSFTVFHFDLDCIFQHSSQAQAVGCSSTKSPNFCPIPEKSRHGCRNCPCWDKSEESFSNEIGFVPARIGKFLSQFSRLCHLEPTANQRAPFQSHDWRFCKMVGLEKKIWHCEEFCCCVTQYGAWDWEPHNLCNKCEHHSGNNCFQIQDSRQDYSASQRPKCQSRRTMISWGQDLSMTCEIH